MSLAALTRQQLMAKLHTAGAMYRSLEKREARYREALDEIIAEGYDTDFAVETARNALGLPSSRNQESA